MDKLKTGMKTQESSADLMAYLIQDILDFAQINSGKFRKNIIEFDIRQAVEEIMSI